MITNLVYKSCVVMIGGHEMLANLVLLDLQDFDVILGMDKYIKEATISIPNQFEIIFTGIRNFPRIISTLRAERLLTRGELGYLTCIIDDHKDMN